METYNIGIFIIIWSIAFILTRLGLFKMFKLGGISPAWVAFIPILSWWYWIKLVGRPKWYMIGMVIPCVNILFSYNILLDILRSFGKNGFWQQFMGIVFTFFYFPYLALFDKKLTYLGPGGDANWKAQNLHRVSTSRDWSDAILFAFYVAGGMRALYFDLYQIPTPSMEGNMLVGDFLVVNRANIGMRIPITPLSVPVVAHKNLIFDGVPGFSKAIQLPYMRLPGWRTIKNNDILVFNYPADSDEFPVDKKDFYVKRCLGIPGDELEVKEGEVYVNGKLLPIVGKRQKEYMLFMDGNTMSKEFLLQYDLLEYRFAGNAADMANNVKKYNGFKFAINIFTSDEMIEKIRKDKRVLGIERVIDNKGMAMSNSNNPAYPQKIVREQTIIDKYFNWNKDNYGPVKIPKRNETITLNEKNWYLYYIPMNVYENANIEYGGGKFLQNGNEIKTYTFKYHYYWMMGDNRDNSLDSRFWGFVPENHVVGIPSFTFFSIQKVAALDENSNMPKYRTNANPHGEEGIEMVYETVGIRWNRIFRAIK